MSEFGVTRFLTEEEEAEERAQIHDNFARGGRNSPGRKPNPKPLIKTRKKSKSKGRAPVAPA